MNNFIIAIPIALTIIGFLYYHIGLDNIKAVYGKWFTREYWTDYNIVEFISWFAKAIIIIPGLVFGIEVWYFHFITLFTSAALIWASEKKTLPTLVGFNSIWIVISTIILTRNIMKLI